MFDPSQIRKYAESIFTNHRFTDRATQRMKCPIHQGKDTNFAFNMDRGVWTCHSRCGSGGLIQLEQRLNPGITREQATERLFQLVGLVPSIRGKQIVCSYDYVDASGNLVFQKLRLEPKDFSFRTPVGRKGYAYTSDVPLRPLYGLPGVITANCLLVCYDHETEVLTPDGWVPFPVASGCDVAQYDNGKIEFTTPSAWQKFDHKGEMVSVKTSHIDFLVTPEHRAVVLDSKGRDKIKLAKDLGHQKYPVAGYLQGNGGPSVDQVRLMVAFQADGYNPKKGDRYYWNLKKSRKIMRLRELARRCGITLFENTQGEYQFMSLLRKDAPWIEIYIPGKQWNWTSLQWSIETREALIDEIQYWDGDRYGKLSRYFTSERKNADVINAIASTSGHGSHVREDNRGGICFGKYERRIQFVVCIRDGNTTTPEGVPSRQDYEGNVYCCTVPSGKLLVRRRGKVFVSGNCEGEKDADNLNSINEWPSGSMGRIYATTSGAAGTWLPHHGPFCAGKRVVVFEDNDEKGRASVEKIVDSARLYAHSIKIVRFSEFEEKMDVTHFLETQGLPALLEKIKNTPFWKPVETEEKSTIVEGISFANSGSAETNWLIEGVIQAEGNGIIMGDPKAGKSLSATDLIINLISGTPWHRCRVPERVKVGLVTREDAPGLTKKRIQRLISGKSLSNLDLEGWLWVNSREQTKSFNILNDADFSALVRDFKKQNCRIVFFDVFNRIHQLDENDNTMMAQVTGKLSQFGVEVGCQVALIHHINKDNGNLKIFNRLRGAGALHGWMEWGMAITTVNPEDEPKEIIRRIDFESKEVTVDPIHFRIIDGPGFTRLESEMYAPQRRPTIGSTDYKRRSTGERIQ